MRDMKQFLRISEVASRLGVCCKTIRRWDTAGKIRCLRTLGGHRRISIFEIARIFEGKIEQRKSEKRVAIYCRVSSHEQKKKGDLLRQEEAVKEWCRQRQLEVTHVFKDIGSGLNPKRRGLLKLCNLIEHGKISRVILTYSDRLTRFGLKYLERYFKSHGTVIQVVNTRIEQSMQEELVQDLIAIVTSFSGRVHGMRSHENKKRLKSAP